MNNIARTVYQANKDGQEISASIRLKKNGRFASIKGKVQSLNVSRDGFSYMVIKKDDDTYQNVRLENIRYVSKNNKLYK